VDRSPRKTLPVSISYLTVNSTQLNPLPFSLTDTDAEYSKRTIIKSDYCVLTGCCSPALLFCLSRSRISLRAGELQVCPRAANGWTRRCEVRCARDRSWKGCASGSATLFDFFGISLWLSFFRGVAAFVVLVAVIVLLLLLFLLSGGIPRAGNQPPL
jgi:hypothetical protein